MFLPIHGFTVQTFFYSSFLFFALAKLLSSACLLQMGDYRSAHISPFRQFVRITNKVTPSLVALSAAGVQFTRGYRFEAGAWVVFAGVAGFFAFYVVKLRKQGRFFGVADLMLRYLRPGQVKAVLMAVLGVILFFLLRTHPGSIAQ